MPSFYAFGLLVAAALFGLLTPDRGWAAGLLFLASIGMCFAAVAGLLP